MKPLPQMAIIGPGKVGTAIGLLARRAGWPVVAVAGRSHRRAARAARIIGRGVRACTAAKAAGMAKLVLLTVPDEQIKAVCDGLAAEATFSAGSIVAHCCGALSSDILASARRGGCSVGSMHPLATFPTVQAAVDKLCGTHCFIEGDRAAVAVLSRLARAIGGKPVEIPAGAKPLYHAAAVVACNYLASLLDAAVTLCQRTGIDRRRAWAALEPLVQATLENVSLLGPEKALTGPIARGDAATIAGHLRALGGAGTELMDLYISLGQWTVGLARRKGTLSESKAAEIRNLLKR